MHGTNCLLAILIILSCSRNGLTLDSSSSTIISDEMSERIVELGGRGGSLTNNFASTPLSSVYDDTSSPQQHQQHHHRQLEEDGLTETSTRHSTHHSKLSTSFTGTLPSSSIEYKLYNHHPSQEYVIISGLGLNIRVVTQDDSGSSNGMIEEDALDDGLVGVGMVGDRRALLRGGDDHHRSALEAQEGDTAPCRIKMYTQLIPSNNEDGGPTEDVLDFQKADLSLYKLAIDTKIHNCLGGEGIETLMGSDYFLRNWKLNYNNVQVDGGEGGEEGGDVAILAEEDVVDEETVALEDPLVDEESVVEGQVVGDDATRRRRKLYTSIDGKNVEIASRSLQDEGEDVTEGQLDDANATQSTSNSSSSMQFSQGISESHGLTPQDMNYPLLIPPNGTLSIYIQVLPVEDEEEEDVTTPSSASSTSFLLLSTDETSSETNAMGIYKSDTILDLYTGSSVITDPTDTSTILDVISPTIFNGNVYYDTLSSDGISLQEYYNNLEYSLLPGHPDHPLDMPGCSESFNTGYEDTVGSYGLMFDIQSAIPKPDDTKDSSKEFTTDDFKNIEIYSMELYLRNYVNASFEIYVRKNTEGKGALGTQYTIQEYTSYQAPDQVVISQNWELLAEGIVEGLGPGVGSPIPEGSFKKHVILRPQEIVGLYVTVKYAPDLRYRNTTLNEGDVYASNEHLNVGVGRSWGEWPLKEDGTDVYFAPREFSGGFLYHVHEGLCTSDVPSAFGSPTLRA